MYLHLNMWAPSSGWAEAYSANIQPTSVPANNITYSMSVDSLAFNEAGVMRVYELKKRTPLKPCIILIASVYDLRQFGVILTNKQRRVVSKYWPGAVSIILPCGSMIGEYLHRGIHTLASRLPKNSGLQDFLRASGPLIAPSANPEGLPPATTIEEAKNYFGTKVDFYRDGGTRLGKPSTVIAFDERGSIVVVREGSQPVQP